MSVLSLLQKMYVEYEDGVIEPYAEYMSDYDNNNNINNKYYIWLNNTGEGRYRYIKYERRFDVSKKKYSNEEGISFFIYDSEWGIYVEKQNCNLSFSNKEFLITEVPFDSICKFKQK